MTRENVREKVRADFDGIARLSDSEQTGSGSDRYDDFLISLVPGDAATVLDIGCGLGRFASKLATGERKIMGLDLSPEMIARARDRAKDRDGITFLCGDFLEYDFGTRRFDCIITAATLHHVDAGEGVTRMVSLLRPGGRLIVHDLLRQTGIFDRARLFVALADIAVTRMLQTGVPLRSRAVRDAWNDHGAGEVYASVAEVDAIAARLLPGARVHTHWLGHYTLVWDKPGSK